MSTSTDCLIDFNDIASITKAYFYPATKIRPFYDRKSPKFYVECISLMFLIRKVTGRLSVHRPATLNGGFRGFSQFIHANVSQMKTRLLYFTYFQFSSLLNSRYFDSLTHWVEC
jgi:hypothetical protein